MQINRIHFSRARKLSFIQDTWPVQLHSSSEIVSASSLSYNISYIPTVIRRSYCIYTYSDEYSQLHPRGELSQIHSSLGWILSTRSLGELSNLHTWCESAQQYPSLGWIISFSSIRRVNTLIFFHPWVNTFNYIHPLGEYSPLHPSLGWILSAAYMVWTLSATYIQRLF